MSKKNKKTEEEKQTREQTKETAEKAQDAAQAETDAAGNETADKQSETEAKTENEQTENADTAKIAELSDLLKRNMAEFDNYRKRTEKEKAARFEMGQRSVVERILPVVDNFERGIATLSEDEKSGAFAGGMIQTYKQMMSLLAELGVKPIEAVGQPFNPDFHNAVMHVDDETQPENTVVEELQKGYVMGDSVVRYSMVKVAN